MKQAQHMRLTYQGERLGELVRPARKDDNRAFAAASLRFWAVAQNAREKVAAEVETPSNDATARLALGYAAVGGMRA